MKTFKTRVVESDEMSKDQELAKDAQTREFELVNVLLNANRVQDDSILFYKQLVMQFPQYASVFEEIIADEQKHKGKINAIRAQIAPVDVQNEDAGQIEGAQQLSAPTEDDVADVCAAVFHECPDLKIAEYGEDEIANILNED